MRLPHPIHLSLAVVAILPHALEAQAGSATAEVEAREIAFAKTLADRDFDAFLSFVSPEAVFFDSDGPLRGKDAIGAAWRAYFQGPEPPFSWAPDVVEVLGSGTLALTSGPVRVPSGEVVGRFNSIWRKDFDGRWRIVFDRGS
jgi:ketosteroid isomerase-like protein